MRLLRDLWRRLFAAPVPVRWAGGFAQAGWAEPHPYPPEPGETVEMTEAEYVAAMRTRLARGEDFA